MQTHTAKMPKTTEEDPPMTSNTSTRIDPVCGMAVDPPAGVSLNWGGREYRFCEAACRETFLDQPERWVEPLRHADGPVTPA